MPTLLAKNAEVLVTMDGQRRELKDASLFAEDGIIKQVGPAAELPKTADTVLDLSGQIVLPGFVNCHHHLNQTLTRNLPACQNNNLFPWLQAQYRHLGRHDARGFPAQRARRLRRTGAVRLHDRLRPHLRLQERQHRGLRRSRRPGRAASASTASRGSMSLGESKGGLPPDDCVEDEAFILKDTERAIKAYHDPDPGSMMRLVVAPCSPFSVTPDAAEGFRRARPPVRVGCTRTSARRSTRSATP